MNTNLLSYQTTSGLMAICLLVAINVEQKMTIRYSNLIPKKIFILYILFLLLYT